MAGYGPDLADLDAAGVEVKRGFTSEQRKKAHTIPGTDAFPIENEQDLRNAISAYGRAGDKAAAKRHIVAQAKRLGKTSLLPEHWKSDEKSAEKSAGPDDVEVKRTTTKPWETRKAQRAGKTIGADKGEDGDEYPIKTIGDVAAAIKKAKRIKDPKRLAEVRAHIRSGAKKINASNMIPKDWGSGEEKALPARSYVLTEDDRALLRAIETKVMSPDPALRRLRTFYARGEGRASWSTLGELRTLLATKGVPRLLAAPLAAQVAAVAETDFEVKVAAVNDLDVPPDPDELDALHGDDDEGDNEGDDGDDEEFDEDEADLFVGADLDDDTADALDGQAAQEKAAWLDLFEVKVMSANPNAARLRNYWARGAGRKKWRPGTPGDFRRLRRQLRKYVKSPRILNGLTANIHKLATGKWPGPGKGPGRHKDATGGLATEHETKVMIAPELVEQMRDLRVDEDVDDDEALARYAELEDQVSAEDAYQQALVHEVDWTLNVNGDLVEVDEGDGGPVDSDVPDLLSGDAPWAPSRGGDLMSLAD